MLLWFEVENFKSIKKLRLELKPFMVFVGPNGSGKTNIMQALALLLDMLEDGSTLPIDRYGGYDQLIRREKGPARSMKLALGAEVAGHNGRKRGVRWTITLAPAENSIGAFVIDDEIASPLEGAAEFLVHRAKDKLDLKGQRIWPNSGNLMAPRVLLRSDPTRLASRYFGPQPLPLNASMQRLRLDASALRRDAHLEAPRIPATGLGTAGEGLPLLVERLRPPGKAPRPAFTAALAGLREVYPSIDDVKTIRYQPGRVALSFKEKSINANLGEGNVSDGVIHALALLLALELRGDAPLAIEEPENALHPWALQKIIARAQTVRKRAEPVLITTHSPVVVDAVHDPASLYVVESSERKGTVVTPALSKEKALRAILAQSGQKLGDIWLDGTIGGVPGAKP